MGTEPWTRNGRPREQLPKEILGGQRFPSRLRQSHSPTASPSRNRISQILPSGPGSRRTHGPCRFPSNIGPSSICRRTSRPNGPFLRRRRRAPPESLRPAALRPTGRAPGHPRRAPLGRFQMQDAPPSDRSVSRPHTVRFRPARPGTSRSSRRSVLRRRTDLPRHFRSRSSPPSARAASRIGRALRNSDELSGGHFQVSVPSP